METQSHIKNVGNNDRSESEVRAKEQTVFIVQVIY